LKQNGRKENMEVVALTERGMSLIKDIRERNVGSQMSAGKAMGINQVSIHDWETGRYKPNQNKFVSYLKLLKIDPNEFIADKDLCESVLLSCYPNKRKIEERPKQKYKPFNMDYSVSLTKEGRAYLKELRIRKFGPQESAAAAMNFHPVTISNWEIGKSDPPLERFKCYLEVLGCSPETYLQNEKYATISNQTVLEKANAAAAILCKKAISPQKGLTLEKAYIFGTVGPGDGYVGYRTLELGVCDKEFAQYFAYCIKKVYGVDCKIYKRIIPMKGYNPKYTVRLHRRNAVEDVMTYAQYWKEATWQMPEKIKNADDELKAAYLRAIFDSQSHVDVKKKYLVMYLSNLRGLKEIKWLLSTLGIKSTVSDHTNILRVHGRENLTVFSKKINYVIKRKKEAMKLLLKSYK
jgi:DNA-binding transcriptional regulator YiaG